VTPDRNVASHSERAQTPLSRSTSGDPFAARYIETDVHMTTGRLTPMNDDHGDQFPGALPAPARAHRPAADERIVRMHADYLQKANSLVQAGRDHLAHELAESFAEESAGVSAGARRTTGRRTPTRGQGGRRPEAATRLGRITRSSLNRFDRYTLDVFNAGAPYGRSER
jgi:hypothetical protein